MNDVIMASILLAMIAVGNALLLWRSRTGFMAGSVVQLVALSVIITFGYLYVTDPVKWVFLVAWSMILIVYLVLYRATFHKRVIADCRHHA